MFPQWNWKVAANLIRQLWQLTIIAAGMESRRQGGVRPPVERWGAICRGSRQGRSWERKRRGTEKEGTLLILLEDLEGQASMTGRQEVQEGCVTVLMNPIGGQRTLVSAQTLANHPALHPWVKAILKKHLSWKKTKKKKAWDRRFLKPFQANVIYGYVNRINLSWFFQDTNKEKKNSSD